MKFIAIPVLAVIKFDNMLNHQQLVAKHLQDKFPNFNEVVGSTSIQWLNIEAESIKIATIRKLEESLAYSNYQEQPRFIAILHFDQTTLPAQNALLKTLEEPPSNTFLILTTSNLNKIVPTIQSRCLIEYWPRKTDPSVNKKSLSSDIITVKLIDLTRSSYWQLIELAEQYKDRAQAISLVTQLLNEAINPKSEHAVSNKRHLLQTHQLLEQNVNVRLALEDCFFKIKRTRKI